jgi:DNA helicase-2/ATP-dependent DNA helicase PcrA
MNKLIESLNPMQREAVEAIHGPLLILAGAGSGKTRVLTYRVAHIVAEGEATPQQILAVTFTNKAAHEMEARIVNLLGDMGVPVYEKLWVSTFHSLCSRILREHIHILGYKPFFGIYDSSDQLTMIKKVMAGLNINDKIHPPKSFQHRINSAKQLALEPGEVDAKAPALMDERALEVYKIYEDEMKRANALDFGDLLMKTYDLFRSYPDILALYQEKFRFVMVDEYQDTNRIQYLLVKMLGEKHRNMCVVGDEDQSIYSWRGADIQNILSFESDFGDCKVVKLEQNYRSSKTIVEAASHMIRNNTQRKEKVLFTDNAQGEPITVREETNEYEEAKYVVSRIRKLIDDGEVNYADFAIFYRTNAQSRVLEDQLRSNSIPYQIHGGLKFYDRMEVKDILGYLKLVLNSSDDIALKRIINTPTRGIGKTSVETIEEIAFNQKVSMFEAIDLVIDGRMVHVGAIKKLRLFKDMIRRFISENTRLNLNELYHLVLDDTAYIQHLKSENTAEAEARIENLEELDNAIKQFTEERGEEGTLQNFLEEMALVSDVDKGEDKNNSVVMMTLHVSKGLEYPYVFIVGMEDGLFPSLRSDSNEDEELEEERRLAYVGITRARQKLFLTYARSRRVWGAEQSHSPSRFLRELPEHFLHYESSIPMPGFLEKYRQRFGDYNPEKEAIANSNYQAPGRVTKARADAVRRGRGDVDSDAMPDYENFSDESSGNPYSKGMKIRHPTFGIGSIFQTEGTGEQLKVSVVFNDNTVKKFVAKYARLEIL